MTDTPPAPVTPAACRAGRALLRWSIRDLAAHAELSTRTVHGLENGKATRDATADAIRAAFARHGVEITNGDGTGARLRTMPGEGEG